MATTVELTTYQETRSLIFQAMENMPQAVLSNLDWEKFAQDLSDLEAQEMKTLESHLQMGRADRLLTAVKDLLKGKDVAQVLSKDDTQIALEYLSQLSNEVFTDPEDNQTKTLMAIAIFVSLIESIKTKLITETAV